MAEIKRVAAFTERTGAKMDNLQAYLEALHKIALETKAQNAAEAAASERNAEIQILQQAIVMAKAGDGAFNCNGNNSTAVVVEILKIFLRQTGRWIDEGWHVNAGNGNTEEARAARFAASCQTRFTS